jgi:hypothetical protein
MELESHEIQNFSLRIFFEGRFIFKALEFPTEEISSHHLRKLVDHIFSPRLTGFSHLYQKPTFSDKSRSRRLDQNRSVTDFRF